MRDPSPLLDLDRQGAEVTNRAGVDIGMLDQLDGQRDLSADVKRQPTTLVGRPPVLGSPQLTVRRVPRELRRDRTVVAVVGESPYRVRLQVEVVEVGGFLRHGLQEAELEDGKDQEV